MFYSNVVQSRNIDRLGSMRANEKSLFNYVMSFLNTAGNALCCSRIVCVVASIRRTKS